MAFFSLPRFRRMAALTAHFKTVLFAAALAGAAFAVPAHSEPRQAPNSRIALDLGGTFAPSDRFAGFVDEATGASFVIVEMPSATYEELKKIAEYPEALAGQGLTGAALSELPGRKGEYIYFTGKQQQQGGEVSKYVLILRENNITAMITASIPKTALDAGKFDKAGIETVLANAAVMDRPAKAADLFRLGYLGPFKESFGLAGTSKAYSPSGRVPGPNENLLLVEPMLFISPSIDNRVVIDAKLAALRSFQSFGGLKDRKINSENPVTIGALSGYQVIGEAADEGTGSKIGIYLVMLAGNPDGFYAIVGTSPLAAMDKFLPELEKVVASFEPIPQKR
ncbi:hypothetical protein [Rhodomicrobium sp. R_RK_3]|uniref:hypothetical protein n=1 Tax=Rhodomicrobium sp. R_RK_3 TaxID=2029567 RepID=UPI000F74ACEE|nr:hypothetical protein [Rhodomicrobium sp. R_RK_3]